MDVYFSGVQLYGDDFSMEDISSWYEDEKDGYYGLIDEDSPDGEYLYDLINEEYAFKYLKKRKFENTLGFGAALGKEFIPINNQLDTIYIIEASEEFHKSTIDKIKPIYKMPSVSGAIDFPDNSFDLITCFGVLHHIPNVTFVLSELYRVLKSDGILLLREPIISMGDWRTQRAGLTKRERGIPKKILDKTINDLGFTTLRRSYLFTATAFLRRKLEKYLKKSLYQYKSYIKFDRFISKILAFNTKYHASKMIQRISPQDVFYILSKH